jgi:hypothetical protein
LEKINFLKNFRQKIIRWRFFVEHPVIIYDFDVNYRKIFQEKRVIASTIPRSKTPILTKEDMDTENDTIPTSSAIFQREKSSDTSESNESVGDVLFGINIDKSRITREQQRLMIHDRKLDETEKVCRFV